MRSRQGRRRLSAHEVSPLQDIELLRIVWFFQTAPLQQRWFSFTGAAFYGYGAIKKTDKVFGKGHFKTGPANRVLLFKGFIELLQKLFAHAPARVWHRKPQFHLVTAGKTFHIERHSAIFQRKFYSVWQKIN